MDIKEFNKQISKIVIDKIFLVKSLLLLLVIYIALIVINVFYTQQVYSSILEVIDKKEVLVIDHNGNKSFEKIGTINFDIVSIFTRKSIRRIMEFSYENKFALFYARNFVSKDIFKRLESNYNSMLEQLKIENGYYSLDFQELKLKSMNEETKEYTFTAIVDLNYFYDGGNKFETKALEIKVSQNKNIENNYFGLIISDLKEMKITVED